MRPVAVVVSILAALAGMGSPAGATPAPPAYHVAALDPDHPAAVAAEHYRAKRYGATLDQLERALKLQPDDFETLFAIGRLMDKLGEYETALGCYKRCLELDPNDYEPQLMIAHIALMVGRYEEARSRSERLIYHPDVRATRPWYRSELHVTLGASQAIKAKVEGLYAMLRYGLTVGEQFEKAIAVDPENARAYYAQGIFFLQAPAAVGGDARRAVRQLAKACLLDERDWLSRGWYIRALQEVGDPAARSQAEQFTRDFGEIPAARRDFPDYFE